ncbi:uncharacterized protein LOC119681721 [Teleopsis dalmanni]|uniref:uncharacterized protein LOC119681721 n=1 Tax=Teleopsis dalmanni TaxID=139649 RepID=UPI0018CF18AF|nr:uncharacterized protein LOC119681721 [Teleopsis dalmanni]
MSQRGYNYIGPEVASAGIAQTKPTTILAGGGQGGFSANAPSVGYPITQTGNENSPYVGGFVGQPQTQLTQRTSAIGAGNFPTVLPTATGSVFRTGNANVQRPAGAVFGGTRQFAGAGTGVGENTGVGIDESEGDYSAIPGLPGVDYPIYSVVPPTTFDCLQQPLPGYYADVEAQCQAWHICALNRTYSFLCPNGTVFSQETLVCVWWNQFDCSIAPSLYGNNAYIYDYGNERATAQTPQIGAAFRQPTSFVNPNTVRPPAQGSNIFTSGGLRTTITGGNTFANTPMGLQAGFASNVPVISNTASAARFQPVNAVTAVPTYPTAAAAAGAGVTPATFGAVINRPSGANAGAATVARQGRPGTTANREYLPPSRR